MPAGRPRRSLTKQERVKIAKMCARPHTGKIHIAHELGCDVKIVDRLLAESFADEIPGCVGFEDVHAVFMYDVQTEMYETQLAAARGGDKKAIKWFCDNILPDAKKKTDAPKPTLRKEDVTSKLSIMRANSPVAKKAANE